jgi:hypothetical protein
VHRTRLNRALDKKDNELRNPKLVGETREAMSLQPDWRWIWLGIAVAIVYVTVLGPGIRF